MATNPVFTDPSAYQGSLPAPAPQPSQAQTARGVEKLADSFAKLGAVIYAHDQRAAVQDAEIMTAQEMVRLQQEALQQTEWRDIESSFTNGVEELKSKAYGLAKDEVTRRAIEANFEKSRLSAEIRITSDVLKKKNSEYVAKSETLATHLMNQASLSPDISLEAEKEAFKRQAAQGVAANVFSVAGAQDWLQRKLRAVDLLKAEQAVYADPSSALVLLEATSPDGEAAAYTHFTDLDPLKRLSLRNEARKGMAVRAGNVNELTKQLALNSMTFGESKSTADQLANIRRLGSPTQAQDAEGVMQASFYAKTVLDHIVLAGPAEAQTLAESFREQAAINASPYIAVVLEQFDSKVKEIANLKRTDPAKAVDTFVRVEAPAADAPLAEKIAFRIAGFKTMGIPVNRNVLRADEVERAKAEFNAIAGTNPGQIQETARAMWASYGDYAGHAVAQLLENGMRPEFQYLASPDTTPTASAAVVASMKDTTQGHRAAYPTPEEATEVQRDAGDFFMAGHGNSLPGADQGQISRLKQITERVALSIGRMEGKDGAAQKANDILWGKHGYVKTEGGTRTVRLPPGTPPREENLIRLGMTSFMRSIRDLDVDIGGSSDMEVLKKAIGEGGGFVTYSGKTGLDEGVYLTLHGSPVINRNGKPVRLTWEQLIEAGKQAEKGEVLEVLEGLGYRKTTPKERRAFPSMSPVAEQRKAERRASFVGSN